MFVMHIERMSFIEDLSIDVTKAIGEFIAYANAYVKNNRENVGSV